jgi:hypothetical protein
MATAVFWICSSSRTYRVFHVLGEVGAELVILFGPLTLYFCLPPSQGSKSRIIKTKWQRTDNTGIKKPVLPELPNIPGFCVVTSYSPHQYKPVFDAFVEFFYQASVPTSALEHYWTWLLFLGAEFEVAALKEECEQYFKGNVDINGGNVVDILELGLKCGSQLLVRSAIDAQARYHILDLREERCRKLVEKYPLTRNLISQAERLHMGRQFPEQQLSS